MSDKNPFPQKVPHGKANTGVFGTHGFTGDKPKNVDTLNYAVGRSETPDPAAVKLRKYANHGARGKA